MNAIDGNQHGATKHRRRTQLRQSPSAETLVIQSEHGSGYQIIDVADYDPKTMKLFNGLFRRPRHLTGDSNHA
ncbi:MAG: hypothetical protein FD131_3962 [Rhodocyclaceae bacterium]|nr:MAG: hypothetical protein FD131_3962 [Rhodocyclaceae bacterium]